MRSKTTAALLGLAMLAGLALGLYYLIRFGVGLFDGLGAEVATVTAVAAITMIVCAVIIAGGLREAGRRAATQQQRAERAAVYERFLRRRAGAPEAATLLGGNHDLLHSGPAGIEQQMLLHASPDVLKAYLRLQRSVQSGDAGGDHSAKLARLVRAMRKDLGQRAPDIGAAELTDLMQVPAHERA